MIDAILKALGLLRDTVLAIRDVRKQDKDAALEGYAAGRAADEAARNVGRKP